MIKMQNYNLKWFNEMNEETQLVLTDDLDSYLSCLLIEEQTGAKIKGFYSFVGFYKTKNTTDNWVGVDCDLVSGKCIANHATPYVNPQCVGFNQTDYIYYNDRFNKFAGSTFLTLLYLYEYDFSKFTEEQIKFIISIDVAYKQFYKYKQQWNLWYNKIMDIGKYIEPVLEKYTLEDMNEYMFNLGLTSSISVTDGRLHLNGHIDYETINRVMYTIAPTHNVEDIFIQDKNYNIKYESGTVDTLRKRAKTHKIFSWAQTFKNKVQYSYLV